MCPEQFDEGLPYEAGRLDDVMSGGVYSCTSAGSSGGVVRVQRGWSEESGVGSLDYLDLDSLRSLEVQHNSESDDRVFVPSDPAVWEREDVENWLSWITRELRLRPPPVADRFPRRGRQLLELEPGALARLAGSPRSGRLLAAHLAHLAGRPSSPLRTDSIGRTALVSALIGSCPRGKMVYWIIIVRPDKCPLTAVFFSSPVYFFFLIKAVGGERGLRVGGGLKPVLTPAHPNLIRYEAVFYWRSEAQDQDGGIMRQGDISRARSYIIHHGPAKSSHCLSSPSPLLLSSSPSHLSS
ncbi:unnamed protein product [Nezara viridula]|uniref:PNT domain-containing protein n=1 Tax=Nezara viridula TaxID=85310 RepID=A0A9P0MUI3_NEZVI|nr:unnamed protein product [Nezara viridula]